MPDGAFTFTSSGRPRRSGQKKRRRVSDDDEPEPKKASTCTETVDAPKTARKPKFSLPLDTSFFISIPLIFNHLK